MTVCMGNAVNRALIDVINHMPRYPVPRLPPAFPFILGVEPGNEAKKDSWPSLAQCSKQSFFTTQDHVCKCTQYLHQETYCFLLG